MIRLLHTAPDFVLLQLDGSIRGYARNGALVVVYADIDEAADDAPDADLIGVLPATRDLMAAK